MFIAVGIIHIAYSYARLSLKTHLFASLSLVKPRLCVDMRGRMNRGLAKAARQVKEMKFTSDAQVSTSCPFEIKLQLIVARHISIRAPLTSTFDLFMLCKWLACFKTASIFSGWWWWWWWCDLSMFFRVCGNWNESFEMLPYKRSSVKRKSRSCLCPKSPLRGIIMHFLNQFRHLDAPYANCDNCFSRSTTDRHSIHGYVIKEHACTGWLQGGREGGRE